ncbi:MAG: hypothetical protein HYZ11_11530 [Candidatus Tectomicrobia bacterium]|uniref:Methionyl-tRNA formyltransferase-like protein n=1 Tax=Tectimicrobiota bacterium TaxID=2528274 RepID=A0A932HZM6_UNCTE|nr:hypothetical protein [Candidatus Tectomicrobia bacterium]
MERDFQEFMHIFLAATQKIENHYFQLPVAGREAVYRERVYCYELYHCLRECSPSDWPYVLCGEIDKSGHPIFRTKRKPDFLVHLPGKLEKNLVIVEVKPVNAKEESIQKDNETLRYFLDSAGYSQAVYLIYGNMSEGKLNKFKEIMRSIFLSYHAEKVHLLWHSKAGSSAEIIEWK